jgi:hypothetical protein
VRHNLTGIKPNGIAQVSLGNPDPVAPQFDLACQEPGLRGCGMIVGDVIELAQGVVGTISGHVDLRSKHPVPQSGGTKPRKAKRGGFSLVDPTSPQGSLPSLPQVIRLGRSANAKRIESSEKRQRCHGEDA